MPTAGEHIAQAKQNEKFLVSIKTINNSADWA